MIIVLAAKFWDNLLCNSSRGNSLKHGKEEVGLGVRWQEDMWETCLPPRSGRKGENASPTSELLSAGAQ